jgi:predicted Zn-dependent peptidase
MYQTTQLDNGLRVVTKSMAQRASVSVGIWVGVGSRFEPARLNGVCHFIEHMLFKGTRRRSPRQISQAVEGIGGYLNAFTSEDHTCYYSKARHDRLPELLNVLMDMLLNSTFPVGEIRKERSVIKEEILMYLDQPHQHVQELLNEVLWPDHPLGRNIVGTDHTLDRMSRRHLVDFLQNNYHAGNTVIAAAGNLKHDAVVKEVSRYAKRFPRAVNPLSMPAVEVIQTEPWVKLATKETEQTQLAMGIRACSQHDERRHALRILNAILGENMSSRLFQVIREDHGLVYNIYSSISLFEDVGSLTISAGLDTDALPKALKLVVNEFKRLREKAPSTSELQRAREYLLGQMDLNLEGTENQMMELGEQCLGYGRVAPPAQAKKKLAAVTGRQVRQAARDFLRPENICLALVSPLKSAKGLQELLRF